MHAEVHTRPLGPADLDELAVLFDALRSPRNCWCTAFCVSGGRFAAGWLTRGNRRNFERIAVESAAPMGVLASVDGEPVGWCACGPRSRYLPAIGGRSALLRTRPREEDESVWLVACTVVAQAHRGRGVTHALVRAAVDLARREGALAIEGWPLEAATAPSGEAFLGREEVFDAAGFRSVERPIPQRVIMRLDLGGSRHPRASRAPSVTVGSCCSARATDPDVRAANLALKFLLELCAFGALGYAGAQLFDGVGSLVAAVLLPVAAIVIWGLWCAPRATRRLPAPARIPVELGVFALAAAGLAVAGQPVLAIVLAAVMVVNAILLTAFGQWES